jgi:hypothetical protein
MFKINSWMSKDSRKRYLNLQHLQRFFFESSTRWATADESPRDFVGVTVTAN